ncbi:NADPH-dependent 1-acyldihydroxyacetone phosphate reductase [Talaromyces pinophilus]|nr:NADPH-dependent 1-acyldihydroxyacetone phosphate reductase [Talaromyces pinophilus]
MPAPRKTTVFITGCSPGGIGHTLAIEFHKRGNPTLDRCHVIATARNLDLIKDLGSMGLSILALDVTSKQSIDECKTRVEQLTDERLDILVNNAGRPCVIPALDSDLSDAKKTYDTNIFGPMLIIQASINLLIPARGLIINNSSASTEMPSLFSSVYPSSKAALNAYSTVLRMEL